MRKRSAYRQRWQPTADTIGIAKHHASKPSAQDTATVVDTVQACFDALRMGLFTTMEYSILRGAVVTARAIEGHGVVKGLSAIIDAADTTLEGVWPRVSWVGSYGRVSLWHYELEALREFVTVHTFQVRQLSYAEYQRAIASANGANGTTGMMIYATQAREQMQEQAMAGLRKISTSGKADLPCFGAYDNRDDMR